jgi:hypothetical protein
MIALEKRGSAVTTEMEILAHMGYTIYLALSHFPFLTSLIIILEYKSIFLSLLIRANLLGVRRGEWGRDLDWGRDLNR